MWSDKLLGWNESIGVSGETFNSLNLLERLMLISVYKNS